MKTTLSSTTVNLKELTETGEDFYFNRASSELKAALEDLVGEHDFQVHLRLRPAGNAYEISGEIETQMDLLCTRCGRPIVYDIKDRFQELIVIEDDRPRAGVSGHIGLGLDNGIYCNYLASPQLDLREFTHEHIAASEPYTAHCDRPDCEAVFERLSSKHNLVTETQGNTNPFQALKNLNINTQKD